MLKVLIAISYDLSDGFFNFFFFFSSRIQNFGVDGYKVDFDFFLARLILNVVDERVDFKSVNVHFFGEVRNLDLRDDLLANVWSGTGKGCPLPAQSDLSDL